MQSLIHIQNPATAAAGDVVLVHGLEGCSDSPYMRSMAQALLERGYRAHRLNLRGCGGTEALCTTMYNGGLTTDLLAYVRDLRNSRNGTPVFLVGFSLGGNLVLKLAGELEEQGPALIAGVCAISAPIDLAECARRIGDRENRIYEARFVRKLKARLMRKHRHSPGLFRTDKIAEIRTLFEFDDRFTAPCFGFRDAAEYYQTQSAVRFLDRIRVPALIIHSKDDPIVPFRIFETGVVEANPCLTLLATQNGGHLGFLSRHKPRFWDAEMTVEWVEQCRTAFEQVG